MASDTGVSMPPKTATTSAEASSRAAIKPLGGFELVVALHQFEHAAAKEPAFGVDLVDRERQSRA